MKCSLTVRGRSGVKSRTLWALRTVLAMALLVASARELRATTITASWNPNSESSIAGYILSYGTQSGTYPTSIDVGNVTSRQLDLPAGQRYYFVVQAYNTDSQVSVFSAETFIDIVGPPPPSIASLSPTSGAVGTAVTISGANFGSTQGSSSVRFNGTTATPASWSPTSIVAPVPSGATTGPVVVTVNSVASNGLAFSVTSSAPTLTSLSPTSGAVGTSVTISGANFGSTQGSSSVRFNGTTATPTSWSPTSIVAPVPSGATTGPAVVTVGGVASNGLTFTVSGAGSLPAPWTTQDVGSPAVAGQASYAAGTFSVSGAGVDIWGTTDQFRFVYQSLNGDGEIVARVNSLQNTDPWAKAAVMIREDLTSNAPHAMAILVPALGMALQGRATRGGSSAEQCRRRRGRPAVAPAGPRGQHLQRLLLGDWHGVDPAAVLQPWPCRPRSTSGWR